MIVRDVYRGRSLVMVTLAEIEPEHRDDDDILIDFALHEIGDRRERFFDHRVARFSQTPSVINVYLDTD